ncbi:MAG: hypothetical protein E2580_00785 [Pseudomonas sp.]|jgi:hypothetical protein|uniref:Uncharacterized protein n=1 Tax=Pseudomonas hunanensis TaxID=1247546 RepID=A0ACC9N2A9_9PSED|nr:hypothetical protein [Pseudomonas sp.]ANI32163.1 hypothetical protein AA098_01060 [Pseudomonas sp. JY-Q]OUS79487.1 hypothetical protein CBP05_26340 [Pseudomonas putida]PKF26893.1 hypothetical protein CW309_08890 [Pseudomonas hunanensis]MPT07385.1 hypothetical protein [Pseudomonas sp.]OUS82436.1 hypothetical protein CBP06_26245 [Pseudomonas putida]
MESIAKAKTHAQSHSGYTEISCVRNEFKRQEDEAKGGKPLRGRVRERQTSIIAARATTPLTKLAKTTEVPDCTAQAVLSGRGKRTM